MLFLLLLAVAGVDGKHDLVLFLVVFGGDTVSGPSSGLLLVAVAGYLLVPIAGGGGGDSSSRLLR